MKGIFDSDNTDVLECAICGLQFLNPMMSDSEEEEYYENYYEKQRDRHFKIMNLKDVQENALRHYEQYKDVYIDLIAMAGCLLEVGSGSGGFLRFIKRYNSTLKVTAIEKSTANREFLKGESLNDFEGVDILDDLSILPQSFTFDVIVAFGVFEHIKNGELFLKGLRKHLKEGGRLAMNIPNKRNPLVDFYGIEEFKKFTYMKQHYYTYTEKALDILAKKTGYSIEKFNYIQVWGLDNHLSWLKSKKPQDFSRYTELLSNETRESYNKDLIKHKMTDLMMVVLKIN